MWIRTILAAFAWRTVGCTGVWAYQENRVTGDRRAVRVGSGHQPQNYAWLVGLDDRQPGA